MANLLLFREKFDEAYRKLHGEVPQEGEEGFKDMTMAFLMCWMIWKEAEEVGAKAEREEYAVTMREALEELGVILHYLQSSKFSWPDKDYVHVRSDILPKLTRLNMTLSKM